MSPIRTVCLAVIAAGLLTCVTGVSWWALSYWQVWTNSYLSLPEASRCLVANSSICRLASALCTGEHRSFATSYSPWLLWLGASTLFCGAGPLALFKVSAFVDR